MVSLEGMKVSRIDGWLRASFVIRQVLSYVGVGLGLSVYW